MTSKHSIETLRIGSRYVGRQCPVTRTEMKIGDQVIVCSHHDEAISWAALPMIGVRCPYCGQKFTLEEIFEAQQGNYESLIRSDVRKKDKLRSKPYIPSQRKVRLPPSLLVVVAILGFILVLGIILTVGKQYLSHQPTVVPTSTLLATRVAGTSKTSTITRTSSPVAEIPTSMNTPQPTPIPKERGLNNLCIGLAQRHRAVVPLGQAFVKHNAHGLFEIGGDFAPGGVLFVDNLHESL